MSVNQIGFCGTNPYHLGTNYGNRYGINSSKKDETTVNSKKSHTGAYVAAGITLAALTAFLFRGKIKNTKFFKETVEPFMKTAGEKVKNLFNKVKNWIKGETPTHTPTTTTPTTTTPPTTTNVKGKQKHRNRKIVVNEQANLTKGQKVKYNKNTDIKQIRHQKRKIIEENLRRAESEKFTQADLDTYQNSLRTPATQAEKEFIEKHNKTATQNLDDILKDKGFNVNIKDGITTLTKTEKPVTPKVPTATGLDKATQLAKKETELANAEAMIQKWSAPGMTKWQKPYLAQAEKLRNEIAQLKS